MAQKSSHSEVDFHSKLTLVSLPPEVLKPRGPTRFQITYALVEISFQNTKSVFKTQNQFSKQKISFQNTNQFSKRKSSFQNTNPVLKIQITAQIHKISFQIINTTNYKSVKLRFLSVTNSLLNAPLKFNICRRVVKQFTI